MTVFQYLIILATPSKERRQVLRKLLLISQHLTLGAEAKEKQKRPARVVLWMEQKTEGRRHSSKTNRWGIYPFLLLPPAPTPVFSPTIPSCQIICDLYHMASKEEV